MYACGFRKIKTNTIKNIGNKDYKSLGALVQNSVENCSSYNSEGLFFKAKKHFNLKMKLKVFASFFVIALYAISTANSETNPLCDGNKLQLI